jgi:aminoglycoside 2''-phosphotransferase
MIPGEPATAEDFIAFDEDEIWESFPTELATFLKELHSVPVDQIIEMNLPISDSCLAWSATYSRIREELFPFMRLGARKWAAEHFETFLNDRRNFEYGPVLKHGDMGTGNILVDKDSWTLTGILEFGSAGAGDPAVDVAWIQYQSGVGEQLLRRFHAAYPGLEAALDRARFYPGTYAFHEALSGIEHGDEGASRRAIAAYV